VSAPRTRARRAAEIAGAFVLLAGIFVLSEGLLRDRVGPSTPLPPATAASRTGTTVTAELRSVADERRVAGSVRPIRVARLASRVQGQVVSVSVRAGDRVADGDVLALLSAPELQSRSAAASASASSARAAAAQATRDRARMDTLRAEGVVPAQQAERAREAEDVARARLAAAVEAARAEADVASLTRIVAPFAGLVLERLADPGDLASPGTTLLVVGDTSAFRLEAGVDETSANALRVGDVITCEVRALGAPGPCTVAEIVPSADPLTRTVLVKAALPGGDSLRAGLSGDLVLAGPSRQAVVIPSGALRRVGGLALVSVAGADGASRTRHVRAGAEAGGVVEILAGLTAGEPVVLP
jgi:membrane fusion protein, multidrug efflux system